MDLGNILAIIFAAYFFIDLITGVVHKHYAERYYLVEGEKFGFYTPLTLTNLPVAVLCWVRFGNPVMTWKLDEVKEELL